MPYEHTQEQQKPPGSMWVTGDLWNRLVKQATLLSNDGTVFIEETAVGTNLQGQGGFSLTSVYDSGTNLHTFTVDLGSGFGQIENTTLTISGTVPAGAGATVLGFYLKEYKLSSGFNLWRFVADDHDGLLTVSEPYGPGSGNLINGQTINGRSEWYKTPMYPFFIPLAQVTMSTTPATAPIIKKCTSNDIAWMLAATMSTLPPLQWTESGGITTFVLGADMLDAFGGTYAPGPGSIYWRTTVGVAGSTLVEISIDFSPARAEFAHTASFAPDATFTFGNLTWDQYGQLTKWIPRSFQFLPVRNPVLQHVIDYH